MNCDCTVREGQPSKFWARFIMMFVTVIMCVQFIVPAHASQTFIYIQTTVDLYTWEILAAVTRNEVGTTAVSPETRRIEQSILKELCSTSSRLKMSATISSDLTSKVDAYTGGSDVDVPGNPITRFIRGVTDTYEKNRILTFPGGNLSNGYDGTTADMNKALEVHDALIYDLNEAFSQWMEVNNISPSPNMGDFWDAIYSFLKDCSLATSTSGLTNYSDYCTVKGVTDATGKSLYFRYRIYKGYTKTGHDSSLYQFDDEEATYVNWAALIYESMVNFMMEDDEAVTSENVYSAVPGQLEKTLVGLFNSVLDGLRGILGLWSMDELLFNTGYRDVGYVGGIFPSNWEPIIWALFFFAEILAALVLLYGLINNVVKRALSTMNTIARLNAWSQIQDLIVCAIALALLPLALRMVISLSSSLSQMAYAMVPLTTDGEKKEIADLVARYGSGGGTFAGVIAQFLFFGVQVYFNFFYALRGISVAFLIIIAPIMIAMISVSDSRKQMTMQWVKELIANICIQPIHAFIMTIILLLPSSSHGFDNLIALYAMIPLTSVIRGLFFGSSGSWMDQSANTAKGKLTGALGGAAMGIGGAVIGGAFGAAASRGKSGSAGGDSGGDSGSSTGSESGGDASGGSPALGSASTGKQGIISSAVSAVKNSSVGQAVSDVGSQIKNSSVGQKASSLGHAIGGTVSKATTGVKSGLSSAKTAVANSAPVQFVKDGASHIQEGWSNPQTKAGQTLKNGLSATGRTVGGIAKGTGHIAAGAAKSAGHVAKKATPFVAGVGLSAVGGALMGAGIRGTGAYQISSIGSNLAAGRYRNQNAATGQPPQDNSNSNGKSQGQGNGAGNNFDTGAPLTLQGGRQKADTYIGNEAMQVMDFDDKAQHNMGISDVEDTGRSLEFTASGNSAQAQELGAYADYLNGLSPAQQAAEVKSRGISATRTDNGDVQVRVDKRQWSQANNGAKMSVYQTSNGNPVMRVKSPKGSDAPSFTGGYQPTPNVPQGTPNNSSAAQPISFTERNRQLSQSPQPAPTSTPTPAPAPADPQPNAHTPSRESPSTEPYTPPPTSYSRQEAPQTQPASTESYYQSPQNAPVEPPSAPPQQNSSAEQTHVPPQNPTAPQQFSNTPQNPPSSQSSAQQQPYTPPRDPAPNQRPSNQRQNPPPRQNSNRNSSSRGSSRNSRNSSSRQSYGPQGNSLSRPSNVSTRNPYENQDNEFTVEREDLGVGQGVDLGENPEAFL